MYISDIQNLAENKTSFRRDEEMKTGGTERFLDQFSASPLTLWHVV